MISDMTSLISGIIDSITTLIDPTTTVGSGGGTGAVAYIALLALPVLAGIVAFARRLVKKARS